MAAGGPNATPAALKVQLEQDLGSGAIIPYKLVPGGRTYYDAKLHKEVKSRVYYNPKTNQEVSEHYVVRVYRPAVKRDERFGELERANTKKVAQARTQYATIHRNSMVGTWVMYQQSQGINVGIQKRKYFGIEHNVILEKEYADRFNYLYQHLREVSYYARHLDVGSDERRSAYSSNSDYANTLVLLGRRLPDAGFPVGESVNQAGAKDSYINNIVIPTYKGVYEQQ